MSLYIGKDNNNKPLWHVTVGTHSDQNTLRGGPLPDTIFHSELPYIRELSRISVEGRVKKYNASTDRYNYPVDVWMWDIPQSIQDKLERGRMYIVYAQGGDGNLWNINTLPVIFGASTTSKSSKPGDTRFRYNQATLGKSEGTISGFGFSPYPKNTGVSWRDLVGFEVSSTGTSPIAVSTLGMDQNHMLTSRSAGIVYARPISNSNDNTWQGPDITNIIFVELSATANQGGNITLDLLVPNAGDITIDSTQVKIGGVDYLSGMKYISYSHDISKDQATGSTQGAVHLSPPKWTNYFVGGSVTVPVGCSPYAEEWGSIGHVYPSMRATSGSNNGAWIFGVTTSGGSLIQESTNPFKGRFKGLDAKYRSGAQTIFDQHKSAATMGVFKVNEIPKITSVKFTPTELYLNDHALYSSGFHPMSVVTGTKHINMDYAQLSLHSNATIVKDLGSIQTTNATSSSFLFTVTGVANSDISSKFTYNTYVWPPITIHSNNIGILPQLNTQLVNLKDGQYMCIGIHSQNWYGYSSVTRMNAAAAYYLYKQGDRIYLRLVARTVGHPGITGTFDLGYPQISVAITELTTF